MTKRAIILVPGFARRPRFDARDALCHAIQHYGEGYRTALDDRKPGEAFRRISVACRADGQEAELHVFEAYWGDLIPDRSDETPLGRFRRATMLMLYWCLGGLARAALRRKLPAVATGALFLSAMALFLWYVSVFSMLIEAWLATGVPDPLTGLANALGLEANAAVDQLRDWLIWFGDLAPYVFLVSLFTFLGSVERIAEVSDFVRVYLQDQRHGDHRAGIRARARLRCEDLLDEVMTSPQDYDEIFVVAHSLGCVMAVDTLADFKAPLSRVRFVTWGSALRALSLQRQDLSGEIERLLSLDPPLAGWTDVAFRFDMMASRVRFKKGEAPKVLTPVEASHPNGTWLSLNFAAIHDDYYRCPEAIEPLVALQPACRPAAGSGTVSALPGKG